MRDRIPKAIFFALSEVVEAPSSGKEFRSSEHLNLKVICDFIAEWLGTTFHEIFLQEFLETEFMRKVTDHEKMRFSQGRPRRMSMLQ